MIVTPASPGRTSPPHRAPWAGSPKPSTFTSIAHFHLAAEIQYWAQQSNYQTDQPSLGCRTSWFRPAPWQRPEQMLVGTSIQTLLVSPEHLSGPPSPRRQNQEASGQPRHREPDQCDWKCLRCQTFECFRWRFIFSSEYHRLTLFCIFQFQNPYVRCLIISLNIPILHNMQPNQGIRDCLLLSKTQISFLSTVAKICSLSQTFCAQTPLAAPLNKKATKPEGWMRWVIKVDLPLGSLHDDGWGLFLGSLELFG